MNTHDIIFLESARKDTYKGLSVCFCLPDNSFIPVLENLEHQLTLLNSEATSSVSRMIRFFDNINDIKELQIEFSKLFVGPYSQLAPPYGSVYIEEKKTLMGESTVDVLNKYNNAGIAVAETFKEAPDHIVAELEFMHYLIYKEIEALKSDTDDLPQLFLVQQKDFLNQHLNKWIDVFSDNIEKHATSVFYKKLSGVVRIFVKEDIDYLNTPGLTEIVSPQHKENLY